MDYQQREVIGLGELAERIRQVISKEFRVPQWIRAEISEWKPGQKGHYYLQLVEKQYGIINAQMRAMIWSGNASRIIPYFESVTGTRLGKGITILFQGSVSYHPQYGFSVQIQYIDPDYTLGEMEKEKAATINQLKKKGLWDMNRELVVPIVPQKLALIAAPGSKGLGDFQKTLHTLCPDVNIHLTLFASIMQGDNAPADIMRNLRKIEANAPDFDAIIIIRGGGAELDLKCFDDYELCAAVARASLPVVTGIGHTDDETICDLIASVRRKTPTDTAVYICESINNFIDRINHAEEILLQFTSALLSESHEQLESLENRIQRSVNQEIKLRSTQLETLSKSVIAGAMFLINEKKHSLTAISEHIKQQSKSITRQHLSATELYGIKIHAAVKQKMRQENSKITLLDNKVRLLHPDNILKRGYSITTHNGKAITSVHQLTPGDEIHTQFMDGDVQSIITKKDN